MKIDPYSACPGGTGKKIKFCCADLLSELDKISRMFEGEQFQACLDYVNRIEAKYPGRPCLLTHKAWLELMTSRGDDARDTINRFIGSNPENANAAALAAMAAAEDGSTVESLQILYHAIAQSGESAGEIVLRAISGVIVYLVSQNNLPAAMPLFELFYRLGGRAPELDRLYHYLRSSARHVALLKQVPPPPQEDLSGAPWKAEFDSAVEQIERHRLSLGLEQLTELAERAPDSPTLWRYIAVVRSRLADMAGAAEAYRRWSRLDLALDDAVEAMALAQVYDAPPWPHVDQVRIEFSLTDVERAERLLGDSEVLIEADILVEGADAEEPPARSSFIISDRPVPPVEGLAVESIPQILGTIRLFGRQTDRDARLVLDATRSRLAAATDQVAAELGGVLGPAGAEQVVGSVALVDDALRSRGHFPPELPLAEKSRLARMDRRRLLTEVWKSLPNPLFGGRTPVEAAGDPSQQIPLLAAILVAELNQQSAAPLEDLDSLRSSLGLALPAPFEPGELAIDQVPVGRLSRLAVGKLSDDQLLQAQVQAMRYQALRAIVRIAQEILARPHLHSRVDMAQQIGVLATTSMDEAGAFEYIERGRQITGADSRSCGLLDVDEMAWHIASSRFNRVVPLLEHIGRDHSKQEEVQIKLMNVLYDTGLMDEEGHIRIPATDALPELQASDQREPAKIWTPHSESAAGRKSAIWTPGSE